jgi:vacuolar iron transporter family protein
MRVELGMSAVSAARPIQAAAASAASFSVGAALPLATVLLDRGTSLPWTVSAASLAFLAILGALGAWAGQAPMVRAVVRVTFWGAFAMAATIAIGSLLGTTVG